MYPLDSLRRNALALWEPASLRVTTMYVATLILYVAVPLVSCGLVPRIFRYVIVLGLAASAVEWRLAYQDNLVENGGDWTRGSELFAFTGFFALLFFGVWVVLTFVGLFAGRAARHRNMEPVRWWKRQRRRV